LLEKTVRGVAIAPILKNPEEKSGKLSLEGITMEMLKYRCPHCNNIQEVASSLNPQTVKCSNCNAEFIAPAICDEIVSLQSQVRTESGLHLALLANRILNTLIILSALVIIPMQIVTTFVLGILVYLTFGLLLLPISLIWTVFFLTPLLGLSWLWWNVKILRPPIAVIGVPLALLGNTYTALMPSMGDFESRVSKLLLCQTWPFSLECWAFEMGKLPLDSEGFNRLEYVIRRVVPERDKLTWGYVSKLQTRKQEKFEPPKEEIRDADIIREVIARQLNKKPDELGVKDYNEITVLDLDGAKISDLEPIRELKNLRVLRLSNTKVSNIEPLKELSNLQELDLCETQVRDIEPLKGLSNLQTLDLSSTQVSNIEPLRGLSNLQKLDLSGTKVSSIESLKDLSNLQWLELSYTQVSDIEPLKGLSKLQELYLHRTQVSNIESLKGLSNLQMLLLEGTKVSNIEPLKGLSNLQVLGLFGMISDKQVDELKKALPKLKIIR